MGERYDVTATGSVVAVGSGASAHGNVVQGNTGVDLAALNEQLDRLQRGLATLPPSREAGVAEARLVDVREGVDARADRSELQQRWTKVLAALAALGITGVTAFGADLAQIASTIASSW